MPAILIQLYADSQLNKYGGKTRDKILQGELQLSPHLVTESTSDFHYIEYPVKQHGM